MAVAYNYTMSSTASAATTAMVKTTSMPLHISTSGGLKDVEILALIPLAFVFCVGVSGNAVVIFVFGWRKRKFRSHYETLLLLLAVTDFWSSLIVPIMFMYGTVTHYKQWHFGKIGCKIIPSLFSLSVSFSQGILILISFERYKSVTDPLRPSMKASVNIIWLTMTTLLGVAIVSPYTYTLDVVVDEKFGINTCVPRKNHNDKFFLYATGSFLRDIISIVVLTMLGKLTSKKLHNAEAYLVQHDGLRQRRIENAKKARKILIVVVLVFSLCVIPLDLFQVIVYGVFISPVRISKTVYSSIVTCNTFLIVLQVANSATNIVIYSRMHQDFKKGLFACARRGNQAMRSSFYRMATFRSKAPSESSDGGCRGKNDTGSMCLLADKNDPLYI